MPCPFSFSFLLPLAAVFISTTPKVKLLVEAILTFILQLFHGAYIPIHPTVLNIDPSANKDSTATTWINLGLWTNPLQTTYLGACENLATTLLKHLINNKKPVTNLIDVGCGYGDSTSFYQSKLGSSSTVTGLNLCEAEVAVAKAKGVNVVLGNATNKSLLQSLSPSHIIALDCAYHFLPTRAAFFEALISLPTKPSIAVSDVVLKAEPSILMRILLRIVARACGVPYRNFITLETYVKILEDVGFVDVRVKVLPPEAVFLGFGEFVATHDKVVDKVFDKLDTKTTKGWEHIKMSAAMMMTLSTFVDYVIISADQK
jgi:trans-aconitate methyltransferase